MYAIAIVTVIIIVCVWVARRSRLLGADRFTLNQTRTRWSRVDGQAYRVHPGHAGADRAADTMAAINGRIIELARVLRAKYLRTPAAAAQFPGRAAATRRLLDRYNPDNLVENSPRGPEGDTSYTIDKGAIVALCLRPKNAQAPGIHDIETLTFVAFHELTHIAIDAVDHPPQFWEAFKFVLMDGQAAGLIRGVDYRARPTQYCGMRIDYNPLFDRALLPLI